MNGSDARFAKCFIKYLVYSLPLFVGVPPLPPPPFRLCIGFVRNGDGSIRDGNGRTALHFAATGGSAEVVGEIFDMAPSVIDYKVPGGTLLYYVFLYGTLFVASLINSLITAAHIF